MKNCSRMRGYTLVQVAVGLLIVGYVLIAMIGTDREIHGSRVRHLISQEYGIKAAFFGFQDRFHALPGDYAGAGMPSSVQRGDGNGRIEGPREATLVWQHLAAAPMETSSILRALRSIPARRRILMVTIFS